MTLDASRRLDDFLRRAIGTSDGGAKPMPEAGGKKLAGEFSSMMADVRKSIDEAKSIVADAVKELKTEVVAGAADAAKALRAEAAEVRKGYSELLGNNPPET